MFAIEVLKVELDPERIGNFEIFTEAPITKHLYLANLAQRTTIIV
jgi:hypothetical protein